jgi:hypothetical protein
MYDTLSTTESSPASSPSDDYLEGTKRETFPSLEQGKGVEAIKTIKKTKANSTHHWVLESKLVQAEEN